MEKRKSSRIGTWLRRLFVNPSEEINRLAEEQIVSPGKQMFKSFLHNKIAMVGFTIFMASLLLVLIGPYFYPIDLSYSDSTQQNIAPGMNMMKVPKDILDDVKVIEPGSTFGFALTNSGDIEYWGQTDITRTIDLADIPNDVKNANIVQLAVGTDHAVAVDDQGVVYAWGNNRLGQLDLPSDVGNRNIKQLDAGNQYTALLDEDGTLILWGNDNAVDLKIKSDYQGRIAQVALAENSYICLLDDGSVAYTGFSSSSLLANVPEGLDKDVVQVSATAYTAAALKSDGTVVIWGNTAKGEADVPEHDSKIVRLYAGRYHYVAECEDGSYISWGDNIHGQTKIPASLSDGTANIKYLTSGFYQNYAITEENKLVTWGLKGYLCGTDELGRDVFTRIINGGKVTMTVGAVSVIISLLIGVSLGLMSGYFGGAVDMVIMRISEVINALPFLPMAMILSSILASKISQEARMYLIMVIQGFLYWPGSCRLVRAQVLQARENEYILASKAMGEKESSIMFKQILPNILSQLLVTATLSFATCMLTESSLSYLGFGIVPPTPTWGNMLKGCNDSVVIQQFWWRWVFPSAIFGLCTISINLMGDGMRDAVDPKALER